MSAAIPVQIPGLGQAIAGLDWLMLDGLDGKRTEINQLGRGVNAAWQFIWSMKGKEDEYVAFLSKNEAKKKPFAAAVAVRSAISDETFLAMIEIGEGQWWLFGIKDGMPANKMDRVGEASELMGLVRDFLTSLSDPEQVPIYTDKPELFAGLPYTLDVRPFSLEILSHSVKKKAFDKAAFSRHSSVPFGAIAVCVLLAAGVGGYFWYDHEAEVAARRDAEVNRQKDIAKRKVELATAVSTAINAGRPAQVVVPVYLDALKKVPTLIKGWRLSDVLCQEQGCALSYEAQAFATWKGYLEGKPAEWPAPLLGGDIKRVEQMIPVQLPTMPIRVATALPSRDKAMFDMGNLAQVSETIGVVIRPQGNSERVAGTAGKPEDQWIPVKVGFTANGKAVLLDGLAKRLPASTGVLKIGFKGVGEKMTFDLQGEAYANP
ncbi:type 4b pilus protein PilO2 [Ralstonia insidiosa]|uniref:Type 4b pilus protein PilO2 n=1 Tax=Ralstonia insidiosa TaxID=190721 RepID=A0A848P3J7_9RALS|nr:type 4b pilus protein PilO2 [Ralstonia insidiosa]NMV39895.1 type 4b pilus protein PilO2 [Ralstonia insidiosa]